MKSSLFALLALPSLAFSADAPLDVAKQIAAAYSAAHAKGDSEVLAAFFAGDARLTSPDGSRLVGRPAIEAAIRSSLRPGTTLVVEVDSAQWLGPDVLLERGTTMRLKEGEPTDSVQYSAIHTKAEGKWTIRELVETPVPEIAQDDALAGLDWLVGSWKEMDQASGLSIESSFQRARGGKFLTRNVKVSSKDDVLLEGWQIIGLDPIEGILRGWTFDAEGGISESVWTNDGDRWLIRETGTTPEGGVVSAEHMLTRKGADRASWRSYNRSLDGFPLPEIETVELIRAKPSSQE